MTRLFGYEIQVAKTQETKVEELKRLYDEKDWWIWFFRRSEIRRLIEEIEELEKNDKK